MRPQKSGLHLMPRGPKKTYTGRGSHIQVRMSDEEHRDLMKYTKAAGFQNYSDYVRQLIEKDAGKAPVSIAQDQVRPENRNIHKRFESLWNGLGEHDRIALERVLDAFSPKSKGKRAS